MRFTLTAALHEAMLETGRIPGYRCRVHLFTMRGDFTIAGLPIVEHIGPSPIRIDLASVATGLTAPVDLIPDPQHAERLHVVDQAGLVRVIDQGTLLEDPLLDVRDRLVQPLGILGTFDADDFDERALIDPVTQYDHDDGLSVIGGHMYHGALVPQLRALYVFGDFSRGFTEPDGRLLVADLWTGQIEELLVGNEQRSLGLYLKGVGQDHDGEIYILASSALGPYGDTGVVLKVVGLPESP